MLKFNNTHIFTGYLKQLLSSVNIPTCRIYTREFADYRSRHGVEDPRVIESFDTVVYYTDKEKKISEKRTAYRANYLRGNELYSYFWPYNQNDQKITRTDSYWKPTAQLYYDKDTDIPGLTRTLNSSGSVYDYATHEYLGEYLRFLRDYYNVNLMSMYNCFNNKLCNNLYYKVVRATDAETGKAISSTTFDSRDPKYRIYAVPVKLFADYTIAIDCEQEVEMFCGFYNTTVNGSAKATDLATKTYKRVTRPFFKQPFLFDKLNIKYWDFDQGTTINNRGYPKLVDGNAITRWDIAMREQDLKLFIKVPALCKSSIVVLEGDYRRFNDFIYTPTDRVITAKKALVDNTSELRANTAWEYRRNHSIINFNTSTDKVDLNKTAFSPISRLQLLALNTGESHPFADRLIEYLSNSAITSIDEIADNIKRAQKVMNDNGYYFKVNGLWEDKMQKIIYDYIMNSGPIEPIIITNGTKTGDVKPKDIKLEDKRQGYHRRLGHISKSTLFDITGYIDKDAEKWYASWTLDKEEFGADGKLKGKLRSKTKDSIQNVDIYNGLFDLQATEDPVKIRGVGGETKW
jgi:hypothetical protein